MRVTQTMLTQTNLKHLSSSYNTLARVQEQLISGKRIQKASEDPVVAMQGIRYRTEVREVDQFRRNVSEATSWMDLTDSTLNEVTEAVKRIRELTTQAANDTYESSQRAIIKSEVDQLIEHIGSLANSKAGEKYIYNGTKTDQPLINVDQLKAYLANPAGSVDSIYESGTAPATSGEIEFEVSKGITVQVNMQPETVFGKELFEGLHKLTTLLNDPTTAGADLSAELDTLDTLGQNLITERAELGARANRLELVDNRLQDHEIIAKTIMSDNEDIDVEKVIMELKSHETVHRAALSAGARIIQPTLLDFLR
ncbi:flagellar hook-associated protein FlgL [Exiguobacterium profundum]|uniref:flagellar hook-associated protein FlgL n=1 Tax=Exiguobacterium TaxID=33986 RepID=UPI0012F200A9|nr:MULTISPECIES: flagellar hook-associated protein FlgL [Exiguobacterium]MCC9622198.1 flagellar hook-associated protein FlgL [Thalassospira sp. MA62]MBG0917697.1 flagellar hook-associated protein FlgL [Exiguobacterium sp. SRB7LM]MCT4798768.1 flagellar hook-associated protein FlgL [Exiguobacterium profundum]VXB47950.1 Flagellar hook-associated protein 3 [Exiguobacterium sp. 8A]VXB49564.1 Flagellar hook-associated protein flgL [Exiguobacterium sp. 8H]